MMRAHDEILFVAQAQRHMRHLKSLLDHGTGARQQIFQFHDCRALLSDRIDCLQLPRALALQRIEPGILQSQGRLSREQGEQLDGFVVKVIGLVALAIEHSDNFIAHHQGNRQFGASGVRRADIARILGDISGVDGLLCEDRCSRDPVVHAERNFVFAEVPADLRTNAQFLRILVEQQDGDIRQMEIVASDGQDPLQDLIQIEGREHRLPRFV